MLIETITSGFAWPCLSMFFLEMSCKIPISSGILIDGLKMQTKHFLQGTTRIVDYKQVRRPGFFRELLKKNHSPGLKRDRLPILMTQKKCSLFASLP